jgi:hypothetical protein
MTGRPRTLREQIAALPPLPREAQDELWRIVEDIEARGEDPQPPPSPRGRTGRTDLFRVGKAPFVEQRVRVSARLSCGCTAPPHSEPVPVMDAIGPGFVVICRYHDEYALVTRVTHHLVVDRDHAARWFAASGAMDADTAESIAAAQFEQAD